MVSGDDPQDPALVRPYIDEPRETDGPTEWYEPPHAHEPPTPDRAAPEEPPGVRPYLLTGGRVRPVDATLEIEAQVLATQAGLADIARLSFEHRDIMALCDRPIAIAEIAARLGLHLGVARVLTSDLIALGYLAVRRPEHGLHHDAKIIERVIRGLQAIR
jgi:Protein of unknown function (DUF742)